MKILTKFERLLPTLKTTFIRFSVAFSAFVVAGLLGVLLIHDHDFNNQDLLLKALVSALYSGLFATSISLFAQGQQWPGLRTHTVNLCCAGFVTYLIFVLIGIDSPTLLFLTALIGVMALLFAPFVNRQSDCPSLWYFNYQTGVAVLLGGIAAIVFGLGGSATLASIGYLFELKIHSDLYADIWLLAWLLLFPIYILAHIANDLDSDQQSCDFPVGVKFIVSYILLPLMFIYLLILYAYFAKIALAQTLPRGNLAMMIMLFGTVGIATKMLLYPLKDSDNAMVRWFDKGFYPALVLPVVMLFVAIGIRLQQFGFTEARYLVLMMACWLALTCLGALAFGPRFKLKHPPMILASLAIVAVLGPLNANQVTIKSQVARFEQLLQNNDLLVNGLAVKAEKNLPFEQRKQISTMANYFSRDKKRMEALKPLFKSLLSKKRKDYFVHRKYGYQQYNPILRLLKVESVEPWEEQAPPRFDFSAKRSVELSPISGYDYFQAFDIRAYHHKAHEQSIKFNHQGQKHTLISRYHDQKLELRLNQDQTQWSFVVDFLLQLEKIQQNPNDQSLYIIEQTSTDEAMTIRVLINGLKGNQPTDITELKFKLLFKFNPSKGPQT